MMKLANVFLNAGNMRSHHPRCSSQQLGFVSFTIRRVSWQLIWKGTRLLVSFVVAGASAGWYKSYAVLMIVVILMSGAKASVAVIIVVSKSRRCYDVAVVKLADRQSA